MDDEPYQLVQGMVGRRLGFPRVPTLPRAPLAPVLPLYMKNAVPEFLRPPRLQDGIAEHLSSAGESEEGIQLSLHLRLFTVQSVPPYVPLLTREKTWVSPPTLEWKLRSLDNLTDALIAVVCARTKHKFEAALPVGDWPAVEVLFSLDCLVFVEDNWMEARDVFVRMDPCYAHGLKEPTIKNIPEDLGADVTGGIAQSFGACAGELKLDVCITMFHGFRVISQRLSRHLPCLQRCVQPWISPCLPCGCVVTHDIDPYFTHWKLLYVTYPVHHEHGISRFPCTCNSAENPSLPYVSKLLTLPTYFANIHFADAPTRQGIVMGDKHRDGLWRATWLYMEIAQGTDRRVFIGIIGDIHALESALMWTIYPAFNATTLNHPVRMALYHHSDRCTVMTMMRVE